MPINKNEKESRKVVKTFALASFLNDFGSDMIYPIWPLFLTTVLNANMIVLGLIDGLGDAIVSISQAVSGYLSDKWGKRKVFIWTGYSFGGISRIGYAFAPAWQWLIPFKILDRAGKIRDAPRNAIIADESTTRNRGENFGILRLMDNLGGVCGILTTIFLLSFLGYREIFLLAAIPSLIGVALIILIIKEKKTNNIFKGFHLRDLSRDFRIFLILNAIFAISNFSYSFLLIQAKETGFAITTIPLLYLTFTLCASIFSLPFGKISDKIGRKKVLMLSLAFFAIMCIGFIFFNAWYLVILLFVLYGLYKAGFDTIQRTFASELAKPELRASSLGGLQMVIGLCALPSSIIAGFLWETIGSWAPFAFSAILSIIAIILLFFVKETANNK